MLMMPFQILGLWFRALLALAILAGGIYLLNRWYEGSQVPDRPVAVNSAPNRPIGPDERPVTPDGQPADRPSVDLIAAPAEARHFEFHPGWDKLTAMLAGGVALLVWAFLGAIIARGVRGLFRSMSGAPSSSKGPGAGMGSHPGHETLDGARATGPADEDPKPERTGEAHTINRPDGSTIRVECYGPPDAPPIVCTHGWGGNSTSFYYLKKNLTDRFRIIVWDEPGLGMSRKPSNNDFSLEKFARDLDAVLAFAGPRPAVLVGHSIGGMTLLVFARLFRESLASRVAGLALVHTTYKDPVQTTQWASLYTLIEKPVLVPLMYLTIALYPVLWALTWLSYLNGSLHRSTHKSSFAGTETQAQLDFCTSWTPRARPDVVARGMLGMMAFDETATLPLIAVPTLVVVGDRDTTTPPDCGEFMAQQIPASERATLAPARHMGLIERHPDFDAALARFADRCFAVQSSITTTTT